ncbi:KUP/HAK/KT family potassium transporter [Spirillospora sp. CA-142024]|uniref:KUP/HAK/KT family potassium transporter n=1 Tax=Spirillospora sp. CA-142024 TaxID=3240036 RepID=UPI003D914137
MTTWQRGRQIVTAERERREGSLQEFVDQLRDRKSSLRQVPGTAVFLNRGKQTAPLALRANADDGIIHVTARFGYMETPDVPAALAGLDPAATEGDLQLDQASYFLSKIELRRGKAPTMMPWRKQLFIATSYITADAAEHFGLPRDRTVIMGSHFEV